MSDISSSFVGFKDPICTRRDLGVGEGGCFGGQLGGLPGLAGLPAFHGVGDVTRDAAAAVAAVVFVVLRERLGQLAIYAESG
jgi:hypothetical protein